MPRIDISRGTHHIIVNDERLVLACQPKANEAPSLDEVGAGEQCEGCGHDIVKVLRYWPNLDTFECRECGSSYAIREGGYTEDDCNGHPAGPFDPVGQTVYCDGSCRRAINRA